MEGFLYSIVDFKIFLYIQLLDVIVPLTTINLITPYCVQQLLDLFVQSNSGPLANISQVMLSVTVI